MEEMSCLGEWYSHRPSCIGVFATSFPFFLSIFSRTRRLELTKSDVLCVLVFVVALAELVRDEMTHETSLFSSLWCLIIVEQQVSSLILDFWVVSSLILISIQCLVRGMDSSVVSTCCTNEQKNVSGRLRSHTKLSRYTRGSSWLASLKLVFQLWS